MGCDHFWATRVVVGRYVGCRGVTYAVVCLIPCAALAARDALLPNSLQLAVACFLWDCSSLGSRRRHLLRHSDMEVSVRGGTGCGSVLVPGCLASCGCRVLHWVLVWLWIFAGGVYALRLTFSEQYPEKPPRVRFTCQMFHPNGTLFVALCVRSLATCCARPGTSLIFFTLVLSWDCGPGHQCWCRLPISALQHPNLLTLRSLLLFWALSSCFRAR